jgi:hypothetical protein
MTMENVWWLAEKVAATRMFPGLITPESVFTLMMICQSRGLHPIEAIMRYDIIENKPALKAATIQAEFQARGGRIKIIRTDAIEARAFFSHPVLQPEGFEFHVTYEQFDKSRTIYGKDGVKKNWRENPADMLWWRLVSKSIRRIDPGITVGLPASEELRDETDRQIETAPVKVTATVMTADGAPVQVGEQQVPGQTAPGPDSRTYAEMVKSAVEATNADLEALIRENGGDIPDGMVVEVAVADAHRFMANNAIQLGHHEGAMPASGTEAAKLLTRLYKVHRDQMRVSLKEFLDQRCAEAESAIEKHKAAKPAPVQQAPEPPKEQVVPESPRDPDPADEPPPPPQQRGRGKQQPQQTLLPREPGGEGPDD